MNYEQFAGKTVLLLGKTKALNAREFEILLKQHRIACVDRYDNDVALIIEGRMMNPLEQNESERLYAQRAAPIVGIDDIEEWLCRSIVPNRLLMSLKLSRDQERLVDFLQNPYITDELFFQLLHLYDWHGEGMFDNDRNRDVTAALIGRFYVDLDRNHNVQYAMSGLAHLIERYGTEKLIEAIARLEPVAKELKAPQERSLGGVLDAMALHRATPESVLSLLLSRCPALLAQREPLSMEKELLSLGSVDEILAKNPTLSAEGADILEERHPQIIARHVRLDRERFERLKTAFAPLLAANPHLEAPMQEELIKMDDETLKLALASNPATAPIHLLTLMRSGRYGSALAANPSVSAEYLETLYGTGDPLTLEALASNPSTPIEVLYQLMLEKRYEHLVKMNPAFGSHIQTHNIGWN